VAHITAQHDRCALILG